MHNGKAMHEGMTMTKKGKQCFWIEKCMTMMLCGKKTPTMHTKKEGVHEFL